ncbi:hypothetical protein [Candidatus Vidania fulgoroideorum]
MRHKKYKKLNIKNKKSVLIDSLNISIFNNGFVKTRVSLGKFFKKKLMKIYYDNKVNKFSYKIDYLKSKGYFISSKICNFKKGDNSKLIYIFFKKK